MYKNLLVLHHLIISKNYVAYFADRLLKFTDQIVVYCSQQRISETFVISSLFILVYESNTYSLLVQRNYF